ncbi:MAG: LysR family transcriptional regulator [Burkholderiales bacterium 66-5]|uniref:LysR family transcriptional regulator n=1 Tax=Comamonas badia TaxID=265291 RepID=UPI0004137693|nr:LysR family transcriptional regulator [Comamonas badia]OJU86519.1 MAG: LysR family transcriptional regulator [Burkholderiales bacterium 66-5]
MDFKQLQYFVRVAELGSFTRAAQALDIAQPALSRQVRQLELELHQHLLQRNGRGVTLTEAGQMLLEHGHTILQQMARAQEDLGHARGALTGRVAVGLPPSLARRLTLPLIAAFRHELPQARLEIVEAFSTTIAEWLGSARMDLGLVYSPARHAQIEIEPVLQERLNLVGPEGSLPTAGGVAFAELWRYPLVMPQRTQIFRKLMEAQAALSQIKLDVVWEVSSVPVILDLVRTGHGFAALTDSALYGQGTADGLVQAPIHSPHIVSTLCVVQPARQRATALVQHTAELLQRLSLRVCAVESGQ